MIKMSLKDDLLIRKNSDLIIAEKSNEFNNIKKDANDNNNSKETFSKSSSHKNDSLNEEGDQYTLEEWKLLFALNSSNSEINQGKLLSSLKSGIPEVIRGKVWLFLSKSFQLSLRFSPSVYDHCLLINNKSTELIIEKDISRTVLFNDSLSAKIKVSEKKLYNVLKAYSVYDLEISYCQGMNFIVATLLQCIGNEKYVFWALVQLMDQYGWRYFYKVNTPKLLRMMDIFKQKLKSSLPELFNHLIASNDVEIVQFGFTHFFLTLFCYNTPIELSFRIIDLFWVYEEKIIFDVIISLLSLQKEKLMLMPNEELLPYFRSDLVFDSVNEYGIDKIINYSS